MEEVKALMSQADAKWEAGDYSGAREDYRRAALMASPDRTLLDILRMVEEDDQRLFRQKLLRTYPDNAAVALDLAKMDYPFNSISILTRRLAASDLNVQQEYTIRLARLRAVCRNFESSRSTHPERDALLVEDFYFVWNLDPAIYPMARWILMQSIDTGIQRAGVTGLLDVLANDQALPEAVRAFFKAKILALDLRHEVLDFLKPPNL